MRHFCLQAPNLAPKMGCRRSAWQSLVARWVSSNIATSVLFWTKYVVPRQIKPGILKLTIRRGQSNLSIAFIFASFEVKAYYRVVSVGKLSFDFRSYRGRSRRMQGRSLKLARAKCFT